MKEQRFNFKYLFEPRSVAIIGASHDETKIGNRIVRNVVEHGYKGKVYPVNPKGGMLYDRQVYANMQEISGVIDVAIIAVPAAKVYEMVEACIERGIQFAVIVASGFSEVGNSAEEKRIATRARENGLRVLGPNVFGVYSSSASLNLTFSTPPIIPGNIAVITQSGALGLAMIGKSAMVNTGLSVMVSTGNKGDIDEADLLDYLIDDENTRIILMYIEGLKNGGKLLEKLRRATRVKPIIIVKAGKSEKGARAAVSHTGILAGSDEVFDAVIRQCGVLRSETLEVGLNWCNFLVNVGTPKGDKAVIITNGGGMGVLATDACEKYGIKLYDSANELKKMFSSVTPEYGSMKNPVDLTGQARMKDYEEALNAALTNENIHAVIALYCESEVMSAEDLASMIQKSYLKYKSIGKPVVYSLFGGKEVEKCIHMLRERRIPVFDSVYQSVSCLGALYAYHRRRVEFEPAEDEVEVNTAEISRIIEKARKEGRNFLLSYEAKKIMETVGIGVPPSMIGQNIVEAIVAAEKIGYPVVMKVVSRDILHKSDSGGVALNLENKNEIIDAYQAIIQNCKTVNPDVHIEGVEISEMAHSGVEMIIGARNDNVYGPIIMCGLGGVYVEIMKDISFRALPLNRKEAMDMIKEIRSYPLLLGVGGEKSKDVDEVINTIIKLGSLIRRCSDIRDIEINPLMVHDQGKGAKALDVRILLTPT